MVSAVPQMRPKFSRLGTGPAGAFSCDRVTKGSVQGERVVVYERWRLVQDFMVHCFIMRPETGRIRRRPVLPGGAFPRGAGVGGGGGHEELLGLLLEIERLTCVVEPLAMNVAASASVVTAWFGLFVWMRLTTNFSTSTRA